VVLVSAIHARCLTVLGRHDDADAALLRAQLNLHRVPERSNAAFQTLGAAWLIAFVRGNRSPRTELDLLGEISASPDTRWATLAVVATNGYAAGLAGDVDRALLDLEQVVPGIELAPGYSPNYGLIACMGMNALWTLDRTDHLETIEANVRSKLVEPDLRYAEVIPQLAMAMAAALTDRADEARAWVTAAHAVVDQQGTPPLDVHVDHFEAEWELRRGADGDAERFAAAIARARAGCEHPAMAPWLERLDVLEAQASWG
jgi:hypothetical protein